LTADVEYLVTKVMAKIINTAVKY